MRSVFAVLFCMVILLPSSACQAEQWILWDYYAEYPPWGHGNPLLSGAPSQFICTFENNTVWFNATQSATEGYSSRSNWELKISGTWGVCGQVVNNVLVPDPYASFVIDGPTSGHVAWQPDTPAGYTAPLLLGWFFEGCGAPTYTPMQYGNTLPTVTANIALETYAHLAPANLYDLYRAKSHTFQAVMPVPEPSAIIALLIGLGALVGRKLR